MLRVTCVGRWKMKFDKNCLLIYWDYILILVDTTVSISSWCLHVQGRSNFTLEATNGHICVRTPLYLLCLCELVHIFWFIWVQGIECAGLFLRKENTVLFGHKSHPSNKKNSLKNKTQTHTRQGSNFFQILFTGVTKEQTLSLFSKSVFFSKKINFDDNDATNSSKIQFLWIYGFIRGCLS